MTIDVKATLRIPPDREEAWQKCTLISQEPRLATVPAYESLDMGDDDLLGGLITVGGFATVEDTLAYLNTMCLSETEPQVARWRHVDSPGSTSIEIITAGQLPREATVAELLAYLDEGTATGREFLPFALTPSPDGYEFTLHGTLTDYDVYREYRLPLIFAVAAAGAVGGSGRISFGGDDDGEFVALFVDVDGPDTAISEPDPQNISESDWDERLGGYDANVPAYEAWRAGSSS